MDSIKSIAIPVTRKQASKPKRAGHPSAPEDSRVGGVVGEARRQPGPTVAMPRHRYRVGQRLRMGGGGRTLARPGSICRVVAVLPVEHGALLYRVRSDAESFERVVAEADLSLE